LPVGAYCKGRAFVYREYIGVLEGKPVFKPDLYLCSVNAPRSQFWTAYERVTGIRKDTLAWLLGAYLESEQFKGKAERTREAYIGYAVTLKAQRVGRELFGDVELIRIHMVSIRTYLDTYKDKHEKPAPISANRQIQFLKSAWNWALERYRHVPENPCIGVKLNKQPPRSRYVTDEEYAAAIALGHGFIPIAMELAYLCRARRAEVFSRTVSDCVGDGLILVRTKGSEGEITAWSPRLRAAVDAARALNQSAPTPIGGAFLVHDRRGRPIGKNAFDSAWRRFMDKVEAAGIERFTLHDLKSKGVSEQKSNWAGHKSSRMRKTYVRKLQIVEPPA
jgi:integrase